MMLLVFLTRLAFPRQKPKALFRELALNLEHRLTNVIFRYSAESLRKMTFLDRGCVKGLASRGEPASAFRRGKFQPQILPGCNVVT
jgi:hypothetical protein